MDQGKLSRRRFLKNLTITCAGSNLLVQSMRVRPVLAKMPRTSKTENAVRMEYRTLGKTGLKVSALSFGVMRLSEPAVLFQALEMGINYFDTAHRYQNGNNEIMLGNVLKQYGRHKALIATKIPPYYRRFGMKSLDGQKSLEAKFEQSLKRLQTDYVDVLFLHNITDPSWPIHDEMLGFCEKIKKSGKARYVGISFHSSGQTYVDTIDRALNVDVYDVFLATLNFKSPPEHIDALKRARAKNIGIVAMKTQAGGYGQDRPEKFSAHQAALKWVLDCEYVDCAIPGMVNRHQLMENAQVVGLKAGWSDRKTLSAYYDAVKDRYCLRCGECLGSCPSGVEIPEIHRSLMYQEGYEDPDLARATYRELFTAENALACMGCSSPTCKCINGIKITERMRHAHISLS